MPPLKKWPTPRSQHGVAFLLDAAGVAQPCQVVCPNGVEAVHFVVPSKVGDGQHVVVCDVTLVHSQLKKVVGPILIVPSYFDVLVLNLLNDGGRSHFVVAP